LHLLRNKFNTLNIFHAVDSFNSDGEKLPTFLQLPTLKLVEL